MIVIIINGMISDLSKFKNKIVYCYAKCEKSYHFFSHTLLTKPKYSRKNVPIVMLNKVKKYFIL